MQSYGSQVIKTDFEYLMEQYKINFDKQQDFELRNIKPLMGICGLYFIFSRETEIPYPFGKSRLIYIGMRDRLIHFYFGIKYELVWHTIEDVIPQVKPAIQEILKSLKSN